MSASPAAAPAAPLPSCLLLFLRLLAVALAAVQAWGGRFLIKPDGVSYLDIADAYLRGDWRNAVSTYWSPLYSWLLCAALAFRPPPLWEFPIVKIVNFAFFLAVLAAFEWFAREATLPRPDRPGEVAGAVLPRNVLFAFAYGLFLWSSCVLTSPQVISPDLLVSGVVYLLAAWVLRHARRVRPGLLGSVVFGLILGIGCLAKAALLPLGLLFLFTSLIAVGSVRKAAVHGAIAAVVLAVVLGGWVGAMYEKSGRVTLGDVSRLNYVWIVNGVKDHGWESDDPRLGKAVHPPRKLPSEPPVYEFKDPIPATFPLWYDPSYWCEGLTWRLDLRQQLSAMTRSLSAYYDLFSSDLLPFTAALALLHLGGMDGRRRDVPGKNAAAPPLRGRRLSPADPLAGGVRDVRSGRGGTALPGRVRRPAGRGPAAGRAIFAGKRAGIAPVGLGRGRGRRPGADRVADRAGRGAGLRPGRGQCQRTGGRGAASAGFPSKLWSAVSAVRSTAAGCDWAGSTSAPRCGLRMNAPSGRRTKPDATRYWTHSGKPAPSPSWREMCR